MPTQGPRYHLQTDVRNVLSWDWDLMIAFPPCTYLTKANNMFPGKIHDPEFLQMRSEALDFFMMLDRYTPIPLRAIENPPGHVSTAYRAPDQFIQPWQFGHPYQKNTGLWLNNLPPLKPTKIVQHYGHSVTDVWKDAQNRSKTFRGIARAMAEQWGRA